METVYTVILDKHDKVYLLTPYWREEQAYMDILLESKVRIALPVKQVASLVQTFHTHEKESGKHGYFKEGK